MSVCVCVAAGCVDVKGWENNLYRKFVPNITMTSMVCEEGESRYAHCKAQLRVNQIGGLFIGQLSLQPASQSGVLVNT